MIEQLLKGSGALHLVTDNAGTELAMDLNLIDGALTLGVVEEAVLHVKLHPTFVSDAIVPDVLNFVAMTRQHGPAATAFGERLDTALETGRLRLAPDAYWNSTHFLWDVPSRLEKLFRAGCLTIIKGDANYRRIVGDALWPAETPFAAVTGYFPSPLVALRTLKSDPVVGLPAGLADRLDAIDDQWRVNGRRGVLQTSLEK